MKSWRLMTFHEATLIFAGDCSSYHSYLHLLWSSLDCGISMTWKKSKVFFSQTRHSFLFAKSLARAWLFNAQASALGDLWLDLWLTIKSSSVSAQIPIFATGLCGRMKGSAAVGCPEMFWFKRIDANEGRFALFMGSLSKWCKFLIRKSWRWTSCSKWCKLRLREV